MLGLVLLLALVVPTASGQVPQNVLTDPSNVANVQTARPVDVDEDGTRDVVVASSGNERLSWFTGEGGGTYGAQQVINDDAGEVVQALPANVDGGPTDVIAVATGPGPVRIYWHRGTSTAFESGAREIYSGSAIARDATVADLDGDGDDDLVVAFSTTVTWFRNDGGDFVRQDLSLSDSDVAFVAVANLNPTQDDDLDLVTLSENPSPELAVHANQGDETFQSTTRTTSFEDPEALATGDVTGNGGPDLVYSADDASSGDPFVAYVDNQGSGSYAASRVNVDNRRGASQIRTLDADDSGTTDVFTLFQDAAYLYSNDGSGFGSGSERLTGVRMGVGDVFFTDETGGPAPDLFLASLVEDRIEY